MGTVDIGKAFNEGWTLFKENMGVCILATLVAFLVVGVSCGICAGPMLCGVFMILRRLQKKSDPKPSVGDVFKGFDLFLPSFLLLLVCGLCFGLAYVVVLVLTILLGFIPVLGWILGFALYIVLMIAALIYGPIVSWSVMLVANRGMKWNEAVGLVLKETFGGRFNMPILVGIVAGLVGSLGALACGIGVLFTIPLSYCIQAAAYEQVFPDAPAAEAPQPEA